MAQSSTMKLSGAVFIVCVFIVQGIHAQEETMCGGQPTKMTEHQKALITECLDKAGIKTIWKIPPTKLACFGLCAIEKADMLTPDGKINHEKALKYIDEVMPDQFKKPIIDGVDKCIKEHGDKIKMDNDPNCVTFLDVGQCVHDVFVEICL